MRSVIVQVAKGRIISSPVAHLIYVYALERIAGHPAFVLAGTVLCIGRFEESTIKAHRDSHSYGPPSGFWFVKEGTRKAAFPNLPGFSVY